MTYFRVDEIGVGETGIGGIWTNHRRNGVGIMGVGELGVGKMGVGELGVNPKINFL